MGISINITNIYVLKLSVFSRCECHVNVILASKIKTGVLYFKNRRTYLLGKHCKFFDLMLYYYCYPLEGKRKGKRDVS